MALTKYSFFSPSVLAFTTQCSGGISKGQYNSFNLGRYSGDDIDTVESNFDILANEIEIQKSNIITAYQTHQDKIVCVDRDFVLLSQVEQDKQLNGVDALITDQKDICVGVTTADCVPILLYDPIHQACAAIHAGWKSTVKCIISSTITEMKMSFGTDAKDLQVVIGPSISQPVFEVGEEVLQQFIDARFATDEFAIRNPTTAKPHIDLQEANLQLLLKAGVAKNNVYIDKTCTFSSDIYFSARRQGFASGRMLTGIYLK